MKPPPNSDSLPSGNPKTMKRRLCVIFACMLISVIVGEIAGLVCYYCRYGGLFYVRERNESEVAGIKAGERPEFRKRLHPVFGLITPPNSQLREQGKEEYLSRLYGAPEDTLWKDVTSNNYGFYAKHNYPYRPAVADTYIVAVFGGSVAQWFTLNGAARLADKLKSSGVAGGRKVLILNLAQGGVKQPQQLHILAYFLSLGQRMDLVVNIDGFNEIALGKTNFDRGIDIGMPHSRTLLPLAGMLDSATSDRRGLVALAEIEFFARRVSRLETWQSRMPLASVWLGLEVFRRYYQSRSLAPVKALEQLTLVEGDSALFHIQPAGESCSQEELLEALARLWAESSVLMHQALDARGIPYLHVLQPNQYFTKRQFSAEERRVALDPNSPYRGSIQQGYPYLLRKRAYLRESGVQTLDATGLFDNVEATVYGDEFCHLNAYGNQLLADAIADKLISDP
ncbi:hypothetical protein ACFL34_01250 [Candidatus Sumerlaeota bacterium]